MTARAFLGLEPLTTDGHRCTRIIKRPSVLIRVHPWLTQLSCGSTALNRLYRAHGTPTGPRLRPKDQPHHARMASHDEWPHNCSHCASAAAGAPHTYVFSVIAERANGARTLVRRKAGWRRRLEIFKPGSALPTFLRDKSRAPGEFSVGALNRYPHTAAFRFPHFSAVVISSTLLHLIALISFGPVFRLLSNPRPA